MYTHPYIIVCLWGRCSTATRVHAKIYLSFLSCFPIYYVLDGETFLVSMFLYNLTTLWIWIGVVCSFLAAPGLNAVCYGLPDPSHRLIQYGRNDLLHLADESLSKIKPTNLPDWVPWKGMNHQNINIVEAGEGEYDNGTEEGSSSTASCHYAQQCQIDQ